MRNQEADYEGLMKQLDIKWEELGLSNDFIFGKVMRKPELCKEMLETILGIEIECLEYPEAQKSINEDKDARSVRLDIYVKNGNGEIFNVEVQTLNTGELPKRSRYYSSMIDVEELHKGVAYWNLKRSYVIFICTFDLFHKGRHIYTFENRCREDRELALGDDSLKIFLNTEGVLDDVSGKLKAFLDYVGGRKSDNQFVKKLEKEVRNARMNQEWRREYMTLLMRDQENVQIGLKLGLEQGEKRLAALTQKLLEAERYDDLKKISKDCTYRQKLYEEYHII